MKEVGIYYFDQDTLIGFAKVDFFDHKKFVWISYIEKFTSIKGAGFRIIEHIKSKYGTVRLTPSERIIGRKDLENYYLSKGLTKINKEQPPILEFK